MKKIKSVQITWSYLRSDDNHQAVAEHADPHHKVSHGQSVPQPPDGPLVVVVAVEESRIFHVALWDSKPRCSGFVSSVRSSDTSILPGMSFPGISWASEGTKEEFWMSLDFPSLPALPPVAPESIHVSPSPFLSFLYSLYFSIIQSAERYRVERRMLSTFRIKLRIRVCVCVCERTCANNSNFLTALPIPRVLNLALRK